jgi:hypothetical protein
MIGSKIATTERRTTVLLEVSDWMRGQKWARVMTLTPDRNQNPNHYLILKRILSEQRQSLRVTTTPLAS